jgi:Tol biopolymer transport system component
MLLDSGSRLGPFEIVSSIGSDVEEVYKATDTEQNRTVALKLLPASLSNDTEQRQRFEREVQAVSGLSHPHIRAIHGIHKENDTDFLVLEYLEGETLAQRLEKGPLPLDEAVKLALAITDALNQAHRSGLVHRNLRPSTIVLTSDGAKLVDLGLTRIEAPKDSSVPGSEIRSKVTLPDVPDDVVRYMAPEQINGTDADARSDIFALGAVFHEMVTGEKAFEGRNRPMLLAAVASLDPYPLSKTQPDSPAMLDHIVHRCLEKAPDDRWQTTHDLLTQLRWVAEGGEVQLAAAKIRKKREQRILAVIALGVFLLTVATLEAVVYFRDSGPAEALQFRVPVAGLNSSDIAMSPDGKLLAIVAKPNAQEPTWLFVRPVNEPEFTKLTGTEDAAQPFWSPDSRSIGFTVGGRLKRVEAMGGAPKDLGEAPGFMGGSWSTAGVILFGSAKGLYRVSAEGGKPELITTVEKQETGHFWPSFLPDAQHYFYLVWSKEGDGRGVFTGALDSKDKTRFMVADSNPVYAGSGYVLFHRDATLFAQPFDEKRLTATGEPLHIADKVDFNPANGNGSFAASSNGALIYFQSGGTTAGAGISRGGVPTNDVQFAWIDRTGRQAGLVGQQGRYGDVDVTTDGKIVTMSRQEANAASSDIWTLDWQRSAWFRLTLDGSDNFGPVFSPDGSQIAFTTWRKGNADIYVKNANGSNEEMPLVNSAANEFVEDWSKDGKYIFYRSGENSDIYALPLMGDKKPIPVVVGPFQKDEPQLSYDGKWLAYTTNQSGTYQVYVRSFPAGDQIIPISTDGGGQPRWRKDGKELFYRLNSSAMVVQLKPGARLEASAPQQLFSPLVNGSLDRDPTRHQWSVLPDGQKFLMRVNLGQGSRGGVGFNAQNTVQAGAISGNQQGFVSSGLTVIRNWPAFREVTR